MLLSTEKAAAVYARDATGRVNTPSDAPSDARRSSNPVLFVSHIAVPSTEKTAFGYPLRTPAACHTTVGAVAEAIDPPAAVHTKTETPTIPTRKPHLVIIVLLIPFVVCAPIERAQRNRCPRRRA